MGKATVIMGCPQLGEATRSELAEGARKHYEKIALVGHEWYSLIPQAINSWEREPELQARIYELENELHIYKAQLHELDNL